jgi:nucleotide-binding universal stress UspA family protein/multisubunit Na+/H+ antiporter MnhG subunit
MTLDLVLDALTALMLLGGCTLATIGLYGLILKPDIFEQLHVAGLVTGPGVILVLLASVGARSADTITSAVLVIAFVLVTSSLSTHVIAHAGIRRYGTVPGRSDGPPGLEARIATELQTADTRTDAAAARDQDRHLHSHGMRVVIAHDGSPGANLATRLAAALDWPAGTIIRLVGAGGADVAASIAGATRRDAAAADPHEDPIAGALGQAAERLQRPGIQVEIVVVHGEPADVIVDETSAFGADLLITGSRRRGFVQSLLGLSAAGEIVDRAPCPVLVARSAALNRVLLTTDGSPQSAAAAELIARWPIFDLTRIHVVSVAAEAGTRPDSRRGTSALGRAPADRPAAPSSDQRTVETVANQLMDAGRDVAIEILRGRPGSEIVAAAQRRSADLIVIGSRGRTGLGRTLLGSVAGEVLASAGCSVLVVAPRPRRPQGRSALRPHDQDR